MSTIAPAELVERIWARDATLWTGGDEAKWLGWLDEPMRMRSRLEDLLRFVEDLTAPGVIDTFVLLGMGGSSLAPHVLAKTFEAGSFQVLDTTHPAAIRQANESLDFESTLFIAASKSGTTLETRCHLDYFWAKAGKRGERFAAITDPGSELADLAQERNFLGVFDGEPTMAGQDHDQPEHGRLRSLGRAAARRVNRQEGQGPRPGSGRVSGRARPPRTRGPADGAV